MQRRVAWCQGWMLVGVRGYGIAHSFVVSKINHSSFVVSKINHSSFVVSKINHSKTKSSQKGGGLSLPESEEGHCPGPGTWVVSKIMER